MCVFHVHFFLNFRAQTSQFYGNRLLWDSERMDKFMSTLDVVSTVCKIAYS